MVTAEELATRREAIEGSAELSALLRRLTDRAAPLIQRMPLVPDEKALLSRDGGVCPDDGAALVFDPWSPDTHRCLRCGRSFSGERHRRHWARFQHLWLAERAAHLATVGVLGDDDAAAARASDILAAYGERYLRYPNRDNVLGPSRLFFSTYLESIWITGYLGAAMLLREGDRLDDAVGRAVSEVADEAANLIGEFDEGLSNRQTWHNAALAAIAVWFEDEALARRAIESPSGIIAHLDRGFGRDGLWYEGENYHLFALRGLLTALGWARPAGVDILADPALAARVEAALRAPTLSALPDLTFPARKDARFGVSLAQPMYIELWEVGLGALQAAGAATEPDLERWLDALYAAPAPPAQLFESYLHEAGEAPPAHRGRADLSWWSLLQMKPSLERPGTAFTPPSVLLEDQGLAVLREGGRYTSLECGGYGGGHGHPDRLHLTLHAGGVHWLPDFGTGSYVTRDLFWYRSTLAHNAPRLDGESQSPDDATCEAFDAHDGLAWVRGRYDGFTRTAVAGPGYLLDVLDFTAEDPRLVELPWHFQGEIELLSPGRWEPAELAEEFVEGAERWVRQDDGAVLVQVRAPSGARLMAHLLFDGELLRAVAPGPPPSATKMPFLLQRHTGRSARFVSVLEACAPGAAPAVGAVSASGEVFTVVTAAGEERHLAGSDGWDVQRDGQRVALRGRRRTERPLVPLLDPTRGEPLTAAAPFVASAPALDGSLDGFDDSEPIVLDHEDQYRRSEEPYSGPDDFAAVAWVNWSEAGLHVAVEVRKPDVVLRADTAPPLLLDNELEDIHSDGVQLYVQLAPEEPVYGWLVVPSEGREPAVRIHAVGGTDATADMVEGGWSRTDDGYRVTLLVTPSGWVAQPGTVRFDLIVNEMLPGRERRAGQLVWSGGGGWAWLRGDRQSAERFGVLELRG
jgi:hypothetical protein